MDSILLIGVPDAVASALGHVASVHCLREVPSDKRELAAIARAPLAVIGEAQWDAWTKRVTLDVRPASYVVLSAEVLDTTLQGRLFQEGASGCAPATHIDWMIDDITARLRLTLYPRETPAFRIGELVRFDGPDQQTTLVGWGTGSSANALSVVRSIELQMRPLVGARKPAPFTQMSPREWLDLYSHLRFGATLQKDEGEELFKRIQPKGKFKDEDAFIKAFEHTFMNGPNGGGPKTVLIFGETGTGKAIVARRLHRALETVTGRVDRLPFHHVNCSTLGDLADVELFGAMRGAYTSLDLTNPGAVFSSFGGTVFLDEFGTLSPQTQAKLLLFLEDGTVRPMAWVGMPLKVPVLVVAATNERLSDRVARGGFRADLYYRFRGERVTLPALRDTKPRDLPYLVDFILQSELTNPRRSVTEVGRAALETLLDHDYPGNVRELQAVLARGVAIAVRRRSDQLGQIDIEFEDSTLPRQDSVVAVITRGEGNEREVLLRWNPYWRRWFLLGGRVEAETFEGCLERELSQKLGLERGEYTAEPVPHKTEIRLIQYSSRDATLKHYYFHVYRVGLRDDALDGLQGDKTLRWVSVSTIANIDEASTERLSPTLKQFAEIL